jgi:hypothetical protein
MTTSIERIERDLQGLLRGEIAAAETYAQVLADNQNPNAKLLRELQSDHGRAIKFFSDQLSARGFEVPNSSGVRGQVARLVEGGAKLLGNKTALAALREGERRGLKDYADAIGNTELPAECREFIERELVPAQQLHLARLDEMQKHL